MVRERERVVREREGGEREREGGERERERGGWEKEKWGWGGGLGGHERERGREIRVVTFNLQKSVLAPSVYIMLSLIS